MSNVDLVFGSVTLVLVVAAFAMWTVWQVGLTVAAATSLIVERLDKATLLLAEIIAAERRRDK